MPTHCIAGRIPVDQALGKPAFTNLPVAHQVFGEVGGDDHPRTVVHHACDIHLAHRGVDKGDAGAALLPCCHFGGAFIGVPRKGVPFRAPVLGRDVWGVEGEVIGKLAPDKLFQENLGLICAAPECRPSGMPTCGGADLAVGEVLRQAAGAIDRRKVTLIGISGHAIFDESAQAVVRGSLPNGAMRRQHRRAPDHVFAQLPIAQVIRGGPSRWCGYFAGCWQGRGHIPVADRPPHRCVNAIETTSFRLNRPRLKEQMSGKALRGDAVVLQRRFQGRITVFRDGIISTAPINIGGPCFRDQVTQHVQRIALPQGEFAALRFELLGQRSYRKAKAKPRGGTLPRNNFIIDEHRDDRAPRFHSRG